MGLESGSGQGPRPVVALQGMWAGSARVSLGSRAGVRGAVAAAYTTDSTTCSFHNHITQGQNPRSFGSSFSHFCLGPSPGDTYLPCVELFAPVSLNGSETSTMTPKMPGLLCCVSYSEKKELHLCNSLLLDLLEEVS